MADGPGHAFLLSRPASVYLLSLSCSYAVATALRGKGVLAGSFVPSGCFVRSAFCTAQASKLQHLRRLAGRSVLFLLFINTYLCGKAEDSHRAACARGGTDMFS